MRRFRVNASVVLRRQGPKIFRRDARRRANVGRRKRERNRTSRFRRRNVDAWRNTTSERFLELRTAENRALQNRRREKPKIFWLFEKRRGNGDAVRTLRFGLKEKSGLPLATNGNNEQTTARFGRFASASKRSDFRLQRTKMGGKAERNSTVVVEKEPTAAR